MVELVIDSGRRVANDILRVEELFMPPRFFDLIRERIEGRTRVSDVTPPAAFTAVSAV